MNESARSDQAEFTEEELKVLDGQSREMLARSLKLKTEQGLAWRKDFEEAMKLVRLLEKHNATLTQALKIIEVAMKSECDFF